MIVTASHSPEYPGIPVTIPEHSGIGAREDVATLTLKLKRSKMEMKTMGAALLGVATQGPDVRNGQYPYVAKELCLMLTKKDIKGERYLPSRFIEQAMDEKVGRTVTRLALQRVFRH
ncbi:hypothetical protein Tco_0026603 [Tanacetum coccineum]